jgi:hypothetical protein
LEGLVDVTKYAHPMQEAIPGIHRLAGDIALDLEHPTVEASEGSTIARRDCLGDWKPALCEARSHELNRVEPGRGCPRSVEPGHKATSVGWKVNVEVYSPAQIDNFTIPEQPIPLAQDAKQLRRDDSPLANTHRCTNL